MGVLEYIGAIHRRGFRAPGRFVRLYLEGGLAIAFIAYNMLHIHMAIGSTGLRTWSGLATY
jgi:hypothetical protein